MPKEHKSKQNKKEIESSQIKYSSAVTVRKRTKGPSGRNKPSMDFVKNLSDYNSSSFNNGTLEEYIPQQGSLSSNTKTKNLAKAQSPSTEKGNGRTDISPQAGESPTQVTRQNAVDSVDKLQVSIEEKHEDVKSNSDTFPQIVASKTYNQDSSKNMGSSLNKKSPFSVRDSSTTGRQENENVSNVQKSSSADTLENVHLRMSDAPVSHVDKIQCPTKSNSFTVSNEKLTTKENDKDNNNDSKIETTDTLQKTGLSLKLDNKTKQAIKEEEKKQQKILKEEEKKKKLEEKEAEKLRKKNSKERKERSSSKISWGIIKTSTNKKSKSKNSGNEVLQDVEEAKLPETTIEADKNETKKKDDKKKSDGKSELVTTESNEKLQNVKKSEEVQCEDTSPQVNIKDSPHGIESEEKITMSGAEKEEKSLKVEDKKIPPMVDRKAKPKSFDKKGESYSIELKEELKNVEELEHSKEPKKSPTVEIKDNLLTDDGENKSPVNERRDSLKKVDSKDKSCSIESTKKLQSVETGENLEELDSLAKAGIEECLCENDNQESSKFDSNLKSTESCIIEKTSNDEGEEQNDKVELPLTDEQETIDNETSQKDESKEKIGKTKKKDKKDKSKKEGKKDKSTKEDKNNKSKKEDKKDKSKKEDKKDKSKKEDKKDK